MNKKKEQRLKNKISRTPKRKFKLNAKVLTNWSEKTKGLIGVTKVYPINFETRFGIHTFGMKQPIDVFILDSKNRIVKIGRNLKPGNVFFWNPRYFKVIETPTGFLRANLDDIINMVSK